MFKHGFNYAAESNHKLVQSGLPRPTSPAEELPGFIDERMLEGTGVSIKRQCLEPKSSSRISPAGNRREHFAEDFLRLGGLQAKAWRGGQRTLNGRFFLVFGDGSLVHADTIHFRHWVDVVGR